MRINATLAVRRNRYGLSLPLIFGLGLYALIAGHGGAVLHDPDTDLHIAVGRWIIAHGAVPHHGIFSGTMAQAPWVAHEWLGEVLLAGLFDTFGWAGLVAVTALCAAAAVAMLLRQLLCSFVPVHAMIATALAITLVIPHVLARPHVFTLPILVAWVAQLVRARSENRAPAAWLAALMALWANLHGGYLFGLGLAGLLAAEAVLLAPDWRTRRRAAGGWAFFGVLAVGAALLTPYGVAGLLLPFRLTGMSFAMGQLVEWRSPDFQSFEPLELWLAVALFAGFALGWRLPPTRLLMLLLLLHMALQHRRHGELVGLAAPLLLAPALAPQLRALPAGRSSGPVDRSLAELAKPASLRGVALAGAVLAAVSAARAARRRDPPGRRDAGGRARRGGGGARDRPDPQRLRLWRLPDLCRHPALYRRAGRALRRRIHQALCSSDAAGERRAAKAAGPVRHRLDIDRAGAPRRPPARPSAGLAAALRRRRRRRPCADRPGTALTAGMTVPAAF